MKTSPLIALVFSLSLGALFAQPANDLLANRWVIVPGAINTNGTTANAFREANEVAPTVTASGRTVWYEWTPPAAGSVTMSATAGGYRVVLAVWTGDTHPLTQVVASRAGAAGAAASVTFTAVQGTAYKVMVDASGFTTGGAFTLSVPTPALVPVVSLTSPTSQAFTNPTTITLTASASSSAGIVTNVTFYYQGTNVIGRVTSSPFTMLWNNPPEGNPITLTAKATDTTGATGTSPGVNIAVVPQGFFAYSLVPVGSVWKYFDLGTDPGANWTSLSFDDSAWLSGPAELGYGDSADGKPEATVIGFGPDANNKYPAYYFRTKFVATNTAFITNLISYLKRDDGAIVYVNGTEVQRNNMPAGTPTYLSFAAANATDDGNNFFPTNVLPSVLVNGTNILAVEVHQDVGTSSDISFDLELDAFGAITGNQRPSVAITSPADKTTTIAGANVTITASAADSDGTISNVAFYANKSLLGVRTNAPYSLVWSNVPFGTNILTAVATDNQNASNTSVAVTLYAFNTAVVPVTLVSTGSTWKYLDNGTDQGTAWTALSFDDSSWSGGPAELGYGDTVDGRPEATVLNFGADANNKYITYYFRQKFVLTNVTSVSNLTVRLLRDDGAVVWLNGQQVWVNNFPAGTTTINYQTLASLSTDDGTVYYTTNLAPAGLLVSGTNVIAVEIHQNAGTSSDISFDLGLSADTVTGVAPSNSAPPFVASQNPAAGSTVSTLTSVQVNFSEAVSGVNASDLLVNGVPATGVSGGGSTYTFTFPQPGYGAVNITWAANHGIVDQDFFSPLPFNGTASSNIWSYNVVDTVAPTIVSRTPAAGAVVTNLSQLTVVFSETVQGVDAADLLVNGFPASTVQGSGSTYTFLFASQVPGNVNITWAASHGIADVSPSQNPFNATAAGATWSYTVQIPPTVLIGSNTVWRFVKGTQEASSPIDAWRQIAFNDSGWSNSPTPFYYGDPYTNTTTGVGTLLSDMSGSYQCVYLRKEFYIPDATGVSNFVYRHQSDDGFVAWVNGVEVLRFNISATPVDPPYLLASGVANATEPNNSGAAYIFVTNNVAQPALVSGTNIIAVQAFNGSLSGSTDFGFDLQLEASMLDATKTAPRISSVNPTVGEVFFLTNIIVTFTEPVTNVDAADLLINGVPAVGVTGSNAVYTFRFAQPAYGAVNVSWAAAHGIVDFDTPTPRAFDGTAPGATFQYTLVNPNAPVVASQSPLAGATVTNLTQIVVTFSKPVTGVDAADLRINGVAAASVAGGPTIYTFTLAQPAYGNVAISWAANHGIADQSQPPNPFDSTRSGNTWSYTLVDLTPPGIVSSTPAAGATVTNLTSVTVVFSEAVLGVDAGDLLLNGIPATGMVSNAPTNFTFTFPRPNGTVINVSWAPAHGITDTAAVPNAFNATGPGATWAYATPDTVPPAMALVDPAPGITVRSLSQIRVTFTEPVFGVDAGDLLLNSSPALSVSGSGAGPYLFSFTAAANGPVEVRWSATHGIADLASTPNAFAGGSWTYIVDPNASFAGNVVINEIMFDSFTGRTNDEWLELANVTGSPLNLTGWKITKGVNFTFPSISIPANGYLVVAADVATFRSNYPLVTNVVGGWAGTLNNNGENIELKTAQDETVAKVHYATAGDWGRRERGNGASVVTSLTRSGTTVTATVFGHGYSVNDQVVISGADQPEYNGRFAVASVPTPSTFTYTIGGAPVTPATGAIISRWVLDDGYSGWSWFNGAGGFGPSMELMNPRFDITSGQNWQPSTGFGGTPGRANSVFTNDIAPIVTDVKHFPPVPKSTDNVAITAQVRDELTNGVASVQLFYRISTTSPGAFVSTNMFDDGGHNDGTAGDHYYGAILPAMPNGTVMEFYVRATDGGGRVRTWPAAAWETNGTGATFGTLVQAANALYQVDNEVPANNMPVIRMVLPAADAGIFPPASRNSDASYNGTLVSIQSGQSEIRYLCDVRVRGAGTRQRTPTNNRLNIPNDNPWNGRSAINLNSQFVHAQLIGNVVAEEAGLFAEQPYVVQYRINAFNPAGGFLGAPARGAGNGAGWGTFILLRPVDGDLAAEDYPGDPGGNVYRASTGNHNADLSSQASPTAYLTRGYYKTSNKTANDWTDMVNLTAAFSFTGPNPDYVQNISTNVNVERWMTYFALGSLMNDGETKLANGIGDDFGLYRGLFDTRFVLEAHDFDTIFGEGDTGPAYYPINTNSSIFLMLNPPNNNVTVPLLRRFMTNNAFAPIFYSELKRLCDTVFNPTNLGAAIDQHLGNWGVGPDITVRQRMKDWAESRRQIVLSQIPLNLTVGSSLGTANGYLFTSTPSVTLFGSANAIDTRSVLVNGQASGWSGFDARWTNTLTLQPGINRVLVQSRNSNNVEFARATLDIWYSNATPTSVSGAIAADTTWTAAGGPYLVAGSLTVNSGATLTIQAGATVYLNSGVNISVANGGRILADGTETAHIRLTRQPGTAVNWGNITFNGAVGSVESRLQYVDIEANVSNVNTPALQVAAGTVFFDHLTFGNTASPYIHVDGASFVIQNCVFPTPTAAFEPCHGTGGVKSGGRGIFLRNWFGIPNGYNDVVDFTGGNHPGQPIVQFIDNVFTGASDDILDLDGTDAWIEGNIFMHAHRNGSPDSSSAISGGLTGSDRSEITIINNIIYDCDMAANAKEGNFYTMINNTIVRITRQGGLNDTSAVALLADVGTQEGAGMYLEGNVISDAELLLYGRTNAIVTYTNNILYSVGGPAWTGPGGNNSTNDPLFKYVPQVTETSNFTTWASAQVMRDWFSLRADSLARGTGPNGRDKGGVVPMGASISGEPRGTTSRNSATLTVGVNRTGSGIPASSWTSGSGFVSYKWRLDGGAWSAETPINTPITLNNLPNGPHYVEVSGKRDSLMYQDDPANGPDAAVTVSRTWIVNASVPAIRINEVLASNNGSVRVGATTPDVIELFNDTGAAVDLGGMGLTDDQDRPFKYVFPFGTTMAAGAYLVVYANNPDGNPGIHIGFNIPQGGGSLFLYNSADNGGALLDTVTFGTQLTDYSIGRLMDGSWSLCIPTFGTVNRAAALGDPTRLRINEWLATGVLPFDNDFVELYNMDSLPVALGGLYLTDIIVGAPNRHQVAPLTFVDANGYYRFVADGDTSKGAEHLNFSLASDQGAIGLYLPNLVEIDEVVYETQNVNVSQGRSPNGSTAIVSFTTPTPGAPNPIVSGPLPYGGALFINEVFARNNSYIETIGTNTHFPDWIELYNGTAGTIDLSGMSVTDDTLQPRRFVFTNGTQIAPGGFFKLLSTSKLPASATNTGFGLKAAGGGVYLFDKLASGGTLLNSVIYGIQVPDLSIGRFPDGSTNWVLTSPTAVAANAPIATLGDPLLLKVNEWMADPTSGGDWFEIYNPANAPVALGGLYLTDTLTSRTKHRITPLSFIGTDTNAFIKFVADGNTSSGADHVSFSLSASGEAVGISTVNGTLIDGITFGQQVTGVSQGRFPDGSANIISFPETDSPGAANYRLLASVVINEALTHTDEPLEDAVEFFNTTAQSIDMSGWWLSDDSGTLRKYQLPAGTIIPAFGFKVIFETHFTNRNEAAIPFALSSTGDEVVLSTASNNILTGFRAKVKFGAAHNGVSFGRYVSSDGNEQFVSMSSRTFGVDDPGTVQEFRTSTGKTNSAPRVGPVVISQIMYHPPDLGTNDDVVDEFIELRNRSLSSVPLYDVLAVTNTWRLRDAVDYDFPQGVSIPAGGRLLVVSFDPFNSPGQLAAFRSRWTVPATVPVYGPYAGKLSNGDGKVELYEPDTPNLDVIPYVLVERVHYYDVAPWPTAADGLGSALVRVSLTGFGNDPTNWAAAVPAFGTDDADGDGMPDAWETLYGLNPNYAGDAFVDSDGDGLTNLQEYRAGTSPLNPADVLRLGVQTSGNNALLSFQAVSNKTYTVEYKDAVSGGTWGTLQSVSSAPTNRTIQVTTPESVPARFYRLRTP